jgi:signal transduction histidine kinase/ActR/RegA family two-component response regulator
LITIDRAPHAKVSHAGVTYEQLAARVAPVAPGPEATTIRTKYQQPVLGYLIAIGATAAVAIVRLTVSDTLGNFAPVVTFTIAVVIAAWYGGFRPGLLASALSVVAADYLLVPGRHSLRVETVGNAVSLGVFFFSGILVSLLCESLHRTRRRLEAEQENLRHSVALQRKMQDALTESDRRKDEFLATLAHELRNPLAPVRNAIHILRARMPPTPELHWARDVIDRQVTQMTRLIDDLMDVARITRGTFELRMDRAALDEVIRVAVETSRPVIDASRHDLTVRLPTEPVYLDADVIRLAQVFSNLLNNAAKYTASGGRIAVTAARDAGAISVAVQDSGMGIPTPMLARVFEPFTQLDRSLERAQGGLGIGLALAKRLVGMHGGTIEAYSEGPGKGSRFVVRLPVSTQQSIPHPAALEGRGPALASGRQRVLVADDNYDSATSLSMLLNDAGYETRTAGDGAQALETAAEFRPHIALLDIGMPKLNGYELARRIRDQAWGRGVLLIAVTGWGGADHRQQTSEAGFDHHLTKPVDPAALTRLLVSLQAETDAPVVGSVAN